MLPKTSLFMKGSPLIPCFHYLHHLIDKEYSTANIDAVFLSLLHWWVKHRPWRGAILPSLLAWSFIMPSLFLIPKYCSASLHVYWPVCCRGISCQNLIVGMISVIFMQAQKFNPDGKLFYITKFIIKCCCCYIFFSQYAYWMYILCIIHFRQ